MSESTWYPALVADGDGAGVVSQAGAVLLSRTAEEVGLTRGLSDRLARWRKPMAIHDPGKVVLDLAISIAIGGDCAADIALLRAEPGVFGNVASDPTVSRLVAALALDAPKALAAIASARADARAAAWRLAGSHAPDHNATVAAPLIIDLDATLLDAHSDKQNATPTWKKGFGFHPLCAFADHGPDGTGEPLALRLRPGRAGANTAAADGRERPGAWVAELTGLLDLTGWPPGMRVIVRKEKPHPGAQLSLNTSHQ